ncbi:MAG: competence/damage-inducible protein A [Acidobacteriota bacterium]
MQAAIIAVGSELLGTQRLDTNSLRLTEVLERYGVELVGKSVVGDSEERLAAEIRRRTSEVDLVVLTGGLGPTADDVTRAAVAQATGLGLEVDEGLVEAMRQLFARFGREMPEVNRRQAEVIDGAAVLRNRQGTAPGQRIEVGEASLFLFPGVPRELLAMIEDHLEPWLGEHTGSRDQGLEYGVIKLASLAESAVEERIAPAYEAFDRERISVLAAPGEVKIYFSAQGSSAERTAELAVMRACLTELAGPAVFTDREDETLESVVGRQLSAAGRTLTTAESCTGGLVAERLTRVPGSSVYFLGGVVSYTNELKRRLLGVPAEMLAEHGAVSEPVARAMAQGVRSRYGSDYGIGITGIAGPGGGSEAKPVGTVHLAVAGPGDEDVEHRRVRFPGDRERVRQQTGQLALELVRRDLVARVTD